MLINQLIEQLQEFATMHGNVEVKVPGDDALNGGSIRNKMTGLVVYKDNTPVNAVGLTMWR